MPGTIRPLRAQDKADWRRFWTGYPKFYQTTVPEAVCHSTRGSAPPRTGRAQFLRP